MHSVCQCACTGMCADKGMVWRLHSLVHYTTYTWLYDRGLSVHFILWLGNCLNKKNIMFLNTITCSYREVCGPGWWLFTKSIWCSTVTHANNVPNAWISIKDPVYTAFCDLSKHIKEKEKGGDDSESALDCNWQKANFGDMGVGYMWIGCLICRWFAESRNLNQQQELQKASRGDFSFSFFFLGTKTLRQKEEL